MKIPKTIFRKRKKNMLKAGDVVKASFAGIPKSHICIILDDEPQNGHIKRLPICCNFTGSEIPLGEYSIDISEFDLLENWKLV